MLTRNFLIVFSSIFLFGCSQHSQATSAQNREEPTSVTVQPENLENSPEDVVAAYYSAAIASRSKEIEVLVIKTPTDYDAKLTEIARQRLYPEKKISSEKAPSNDMPPLAKTSIDQMMSDELVRKYPEYLRKTKATVSKIGKAEIVGELASVTVTLNWPDGRFPDDKEIVHLGRESNSWRIFKIGTPEWESVMP